MSKKSSYRACPIKRPRRSKAAINEIRDNIAALLENDNPMTVRQLFYRLVSMGVIAKTEAEYQNTVVRLCGLMRREEQIPFGWIADGTRWQRKPQSYSSLKQMLRRAQRTYRQAIWADQPAYVEIWLEKEALAGVLIDVTAEWDVPLMVTRGYPSLSYLYECAENIACQDRPSFIYYFGDHDPSGLDIQDKVERDLRNFAPNAELHVERAAVKRWQIEHFDLPTRPTKQTDTRAKNFEGESVEVDAIAPEKLRAIARLCIEQHVDQGLLERTRLVEQAEKETLDRVLVSLEDAT